MLIFTEPNNVLNFEVQTVVVVKPAVCLLNHVVWLKLPAFRRTLPSQSPG